jgi:DNA polymerase-4
MKKIIHVDMDCFYAQVEMRDNPALKNLPIAVGGLPKTRSVLCTSNYEARKYGVRSAMPTDLAIRKCPKLVVIVPDFKKYEAASEIIQKIFLKYTDLVEPLSLDEAFLDVSHEAHASLLLKEIKNQILKETELTSSIGLAPNKFLAKIASDWKKPDGEFVIKPHQVEEFVKNLKVKLIPGVGAKTHEALLALKIETLNDIRNTDPTILHSHFGKFSTDLINYSLGIDEREVIADFERKSLSVENTFLVDHFWSDKLEIEFNEVLTELDRRLENNNSLIKKIFTKVRFSDFTRTTAEITIPIDQNFRPHHYKTQFLELLKTNLSKRVLPVRLIGVGVRFLPDSENNNNQQLLLFS